MQQQSNNSHKFVLPGESVHIKDAKFNTNSFSEEGGQPKSLYFGLLNIKDIGGLNYVDVVKRVTTYIPEKNHFVVGIIKARVGDNYIVDINAPIDGLLGNLDFDGATKRNRPNLNSGDLIFTRIVEYSKFIGTKVSCLNPGFSSKNVLGDLKGGMVAYGLRGRQKLIEQKIQVIKNYCKFQIAFGKNDVLWFSCNDLNTQMILYNIFTELLKGCSQQLFQTLLKMLKV